MSTDNTQTKSTGPRTEEGKAISSQNARKTGLFAARDFIHPGEEQEYEELRQSLQTELKPEGTLERYIAAEILAALWRLRRCGQLELNLAVPASGDETIAKQQLSIDRGRNQATRLLHKNTAELRGLQTERQFRHEISEEGVPVENLGLGDFYTAITRAGRIVKNLQRSQYDELKTKLDTLQIVGRCNAVKRVIAVRESELTKRTPSAEQGSIGDTLPRQPELFNKAA